MTVNYKGLLNGNHSPVDLAKAIVNLYGGDAFNIRFGSEGILSYGGACGVNSGHYIIEFSQEFEESVKALRPWERKKHRVPRSMHVFTDGACASDYADLTTEPMTYLSLGHSGHCREIIDALVAHYGGYVLDEQGSDDWEHLSPEAIAAAQMRAAERRNSKNTKDAEYAARHAAEVPAAG